MTEDLEKRLKALEKKLQASLSDAQMDFFEVVDPEGDTSNEYIAFRIPDQAETRDLDLRLVTLGGSRPRGQEPDS